MKYNKKNRSVADKIDAVITLHNAQSPGVPLTISALARQAGVSRANLYVSHPQVLEKLSRKNDKESRPDVGRRRGDAMVKSSNELSELKRINKALLLLNIELRQEILRLNRRLSEIQQGKSRS